MLTIALALAAAAASMPVTDLAPMDGRNPASSRPTVQRPTEDGPMVPTKRPLKVAGYLSRLNGVGVPSANTVEYWLWWMESDHARYQCVRQGNCVNRQG